MQALKIFRVAESSLIYRYGKMKDQFGWPDDTEEITNAAVGMVSGQSPVTNVEDTSSTNISQPVAGPLDK